MPRPKPKSKPQRTPKPRKPLGGASSASPTTANPPQLGGASSASPTSGPSGPPNHTGHKLTALASLKPNPRNPNTHPEAQIALLARIIAHQGWRAPIVVSERSGLIVAGHARLAAAQRLGLSQAPVNFQAFATDEDELAHLLADNKIAELADLDLDDVKTILGELSLDMRELAGFDATELDQIFATSQEISDAAAKADQAHELNKKWKVKAGDLFAIGDHRLLCGDSTESNDVKRCLNGAKPWLMVTDPPYGVNYDPSWRHECNLNNSNTLGKVTNDNRSKWAGAYTRSGCEVAYVWHSSIYASTVANDLIACGFKIRSQIMWAKKRFPISRCDYHCAHEPCWYAVKEGATGRFYGNRKNTTLWADISDSLTDKGGELYACQIDKETVYAFPATSTTLWTLPQDKPCDGGHSTQKPLECMARPIRNHGMEGDAVYDPFAGTGTTGIAAHANKRVAYMIEIAPQYCAVILERFKQSCRIEGKRIP